MRDYSDIINLPRHVSKTKAPMPLEDRAAQFSPFAALEGHRSAIDETARYTEERISLNEDALSELDFKLQILLENISSLPELEVSFFKADELKQGGAYLCHSGHLSKFDEFERKLYFTDGKQFFLDDISDIRSPLFCLEF